MSATSRPLLPPPPPLPLLPPPPPRSSRKKQLMSPQEKVDELWTKYRTKAPGKVTRIIPQNEVFERAARHASALQSKEKAMTTDQSYEAAVEQCKHKVAQIVKECRRVNLKYRDQHFDLELDHGLARRDCMDSLNNEREAHSLYFRRRSKRRSGVPFNDRDPSPSRATTSTSTKPAAGLGSGGVLGYLNALEKENVQSDGEANFEFHPKSVKRVVDIFDNPQFFIDGPSANDVRQGRDGDCWLMAALCTLSNKPGLIERCCVARDQDVGVYGFVFHRDGEWFSEIIDDKLYLTKPDYDDSRSERIMWEDRERVNSEEAYRKAYQSNSGALYFAQCVNPNETWLPLLEKAYAKAHGDYSAIEGGFGGEGIEDLTGGVTSEVFSSDILDKEYFWKEELLKVNQDFLFGCSTGVWGRGWGERKGIVELHAYSVLKACEIDGVRLVLLKNPWGKHEWKGPWSDGSKEWTADWLKKLDHQFGDDGSFWISYSDLLRKYQAFDRTRLFNPGEWKVASIWTTLNISWIVDYHDTKFAFTLARSGPVVIVFSQLDERYFKGLQGQYRFELSFRVHKAGEEDYVVRSQNAYRMNRSANVELELEAGEYVVVVKIDAQRREDLMPVEEVVRAYAKERPDKLFRIGRAYDVAHSKGKIVETAEEKEAREAFEQKKKERDRRKCARALQEKKREKKRADLKKKLRERRAEEKAEAKRKTKAERRAARREARAKSKAEAEVEQDGDKETLEEPYTDQKPSDENDAKSQPVENNEQPGADESENQTGKPTAETKEKSSDKKDPSSATKDDAQDQHVGNKTTSTETTSSEKAQTKDTATQKSNGKEKSKSPAQSTDVKKDQGSATTSTGTTENTPGSSLSSCPTPTSTEEAQEDEEEIYITAAETDTEHHQHKHQTSTAGEGDHNAPATPRPATKSASTTATTAKSVPPQNKSIGVQTGPGLQIPSTPAPPSLSDMRRSPPPVIRSIYGPPPYGLAPSLPPNFSQLPPHVRAAIIRGYGGHGRLSLDGVPPLPPISDSETHTLSSTASDSELNTDVDDVSEVSDEDIDRFVEGLEAAAAAAAAAASSASSSGPRTPPGVVFPPPPGLLAAVPEPPDDFDNDPWNAVGVFGLRVYYKIPEKKGKGKGKDKDTVKNEVKENDDKENREEEEEEEEEMVRLRVERPNPYLWEDSSDDEADDESEDKKKPRTLEKEESKVLDIDDSAKDLVGEQTAVSLAAEGLVGGEDGKVGKEGGGEGGGGGEGETVKEKNIEKDDSKKDGPAVEAVVQE